MTEAYRLQHTKIVKDVQKGVNHGQSAIDALRLASVLLQKLEAAKQPVSLEKRLKTAIGGLRSIAYGDARTWPKADPRLVAIQALADCDGEKYKEGV